MSAFLPLSLALCFDVNIHVPGAGPEAISPLWTGILRNRIWYLQEPLVLTVSRDLWLLQLGAPPGSDLLPLGWVQCLFGDGWLPMRQLSQCQCGFFGSRSLPQEGLPLQSFLPPLGEHSDIIDGFPYCHSYCFVCPLFFNMGLLFPEVPWEVPPSGSPAGFLLKTHGPFSCKF